LLPFAAYHPHGVLALHGALPDVERVEEIEKVQLGSPDWRKITWGDWADAPGYALDSGVFGRPTFGRDFFEEIMERLGLKVLVRSHQPFAPTFLSSCVREDLCGMPGTWSSQAYKSRAPGGAEEEIGKNWGQGFTFDFWVEVVWPTALVRPKGHSMVSKRGLVLDLCCTQMGLDAVLYVNPLRLQRPDKANPSGTPHGR